jgi:hypothetical protein
MDLNCVLIFSKKIVGAETLETPVTGALTGLETAAPRSSPMPEVSGEATRLASGVSTAALDDAEARVGCAVDRDAAIADRIGEEPADVVVFGVAGEFDPSRLEAVAAVDTAFAVEDKVEMNSASLVFSSREDAVTALNFDQVFELNVR